MLLKVITHLFRPSYSRFTFNFRFLFYPIPRPNCNDLALFTCPIPKFIFNNVEIPLYVGTITFINVFITVAYSAVMYVIYTGKFPFF